MIIIWAFILLLILLDKSNTHTHTHKIRGFVCTLWIQLQMETFVREHRDASFRIVIIVNNGVLLECVCVWNVTLAVVVVMLVMVLVLVCLWHCGAPLWTLNARLPSAAASTKRVMYNDSVVCYYNKVLYLSLTTGHISHSPPSSPQKQQNVPLNSAAPPPDALKSAFASWVDIRWSSKLCLPSAIYYQHAW